MKQKLKRKNKEITKCTLTVREVHFLFSLTEQIEQKYKIDKRHEELKQCKSTWPNSKNSHLQKNLHKVRAEQIKYFFLKAHIKTDNPCSVSLKKWKWIITQRYWMRNQQDLKISKIFQQ